jgi:aminoglycoside phosphotransferase family enzyme
LSGELRNFGQHLQQAGLAGKSPELSPGLATDFTELAELIIRFHSNARARDVLRNTDTEVGRICRSLGNSIGATRTNGLRGTVTAHWTQRLAEQKAEFLSKTNYTDKRALAATFRKLLQRQTSQDLVLLSLRRSLLHLAELHHALAQGDPLTAQSASAAIANEVQHSRDLYGRYTANPVNP